MALDPQKLGDYGTFGGFVLAALGALWALLKYPFMSKSYAFRVFLTKETLDKEFVKKVESDGTRTYVHVSELAEIKSLLNQNLSETQKWQAIAKDWMNRP